MKTLRMSVVDAIIDRVRRTRPDQAAKWQRITREDLKWWLARAGELEWIFAKTYADSAPHSYVVEGRTAGLSKEDYVRAARVIHTFGRPAKFYGMTNIYLTSPGGELKWWTMDAEVTATTLINQATTKRAYGVQNAPVTASGIDARYDGIATAWDEMRPSSERLAADLRKAFMSLGGEYPPAVLDIGCGTGRVLDLGLTKVDRYCGVDLSTAMLNQLVRKHPGVGAVYPVGWEDAVDRGLFTEGQFEIVTMVLPEDVEIQAVGVQAAATVASRGLITARGEVVTVTRTHA